MRDSRTFLILSVTLLLTIVSCIPQMTLTPTAHPAVTPIPPTVSPVLETIKGSFRNQIGILEETMPRAKSEGYVVPSNQEQEDFAKLVSMINNDKLTSTADLLTQSSYRLNYYVDRGDDYAVSYLLREQQPIEKGWGLYAFRLDSTSNIIVEAPHPLYDRRTPSVALDLYRALDARALLIAGAHRNANDDGSADAAHAPDSIFQSVHETLVKEIQSSTGQVIVLQIHGFHTSKHDGYPQAVLGFGKSIDSMELTLGQELENIFRKQGLNAGVCTGNNWKDLCGKTNIQAASMSGGMFIHIELDEKVRKNDEALIAAIVHVFGK
jgi:hypothetical protein